MAAPTFLPHCFEVIIASPDKSDAAATRKKFTDGFAIQRKHPDFVGIVLEGIKVEDENVALRIIEWTSYEGHMRFRASPSYAEFTEARKGAYLPTPAITHYNFTSPLPSPPPPIMEYFRLTLKPGTPFAPFHAAFSHALRNVASASVSVSIGQQAEDASEVLCLIGWERWEDHMVEFRNSAGFEEWKVEIGEILEAYVRGGRQGTEMWHAKTCEPGIGV